MAGSPIVFRTDQGASGASNTAKTAVDIVALLALGACGPGYLGRPYAPSHMHRTPFRGSSGSMVLPEPGDDARDLRRSP
jgi:hypothetical protein